MPNVMKEFKSFWRNRQDSLYESDLCERSQDYCKADKTASNAFAILKLGLSEDVLQNELISLVQSQMKMETISNSIFYEEGFKDGIKVILSIINE